MKNILITVVMLIVVVVLFANAIQGKAVPAIENKATQMSNTVGGAVPLNKHSK